MSRPNWKGQTAVIVASGPSLAPEQLLAVERADVRTIAVNSTAYAMQPDVVYAGDFLWWKVHHAKIRAACPRAQLWTQDATSAERYRVARIKGTGRPGLGREVIHTNGNSGAQAINLAFLFGARRILLLGFDMKRGPKGERHWHPDHPAPLVQDQCFDEWIKKFGPLAADLKAAGCEVINCTPGSALTCFPMSTIEKELG